MPKLISVEILMLTGEVPADDADFRLKTSLLVRNFLMLRGGYA
jgi:hypothetical protein